MTLLSGEGQARAERHNGRLNRCVRAKAPIRAPSPLGVAGDSTRFARWPFCDREWVVRARVQYSGTDCPNFVTETGKAALLTCRRRLQRVREQWSCGRIINQSIKRQRKGTKVARGIVERPPGREQAGRGPFWPDSHLAQATE